MFDSQQYTFPVPGETRSETASLDAGVYLLGGRCHVAAQRSQAEYRLIAAGALRIGTLRFDPDPLERSHAERVVRPLRGAEAVERFAASGTPN